jgi:hypothetical protein
LVLLRAEIARFTRRAPRSFLRRNFDPQLKETNRR